MFETIGLVIAIAAGLFLCGTVLFSKWLWRRLEKKWTANRIAFSPLFAAMILSFWIALLGFSVYMALYGMAAFFFAVSCLFPWLFRRDKAVEYDEEGITVHTGAHCVRVRYDCLSAVYTDANGAPDCPRVPTRSRFVLVIEYRHSPNGNAAEPLLIPVDLCVGVPRFIAYATARTESEEQDDL